MESTNLGGNRCAHDKTSFKKPCFYANRYKLARCPHSIEEALRRIDKAEKKLKDFPNRSRVSLFEEEKFWKLLYHTGKDGKKRYRRSERLESTIFLCLRIIIKSCELSKMACGFFNNRNKFIYYDYGFLTEQTGLTMSRVKRAMGVLKHEGMLRTDRIVELLDDGSIRNKEVIISVSEDLFLMLGLEKEFSTDRNKKMLKWNEKHNRMQKEKLRLSAFMPKPLKDRLTKNVRVKSTLNTSKTTQIKSLTDKVSSKYYLSNTYNPAQDKRVISLAGEIIKSKQISDLRSAIDISCKMLGKSPPH